MCRQVTREGACAAASFSPRGNSGALSKSKKSVDREPEAGHCCERGGALGGAGESRHSVGSAVGIDR